MFIYTNGKNKDFNKSACKTGSSNPCMKGYLSLFDLKPNFPQCLSYTVTAIYSFYPFPNKPWFLRVCSTSLLKTLWEKENCS